MFIFQLIRYCINSEVETEIGRTKIWKNQVLGNNTTAEWSKT